MSIPDDLILRYFRLATSATEQRIRQMDTAMEAGTNPRDFKMQLAHSIVEQFHGPAAAETAASEFKRRVQDKEEPDVMREVEVGAEEQPVSSLFFVAQLVSSKSEARRLVDQKGLYINNKLVTNAEERVTPKAGWVLRRGNHRFAKLALYKG